jgi:hypothetical protein
VPRRQHLTDLGIIRGYSRLNTKIKGLQQELHQILTLLTSPVKLTQNEKLILLSLPSHLIKTYFTLESLGTARATEISNLTHKQRAVESSYLNQLAIMGYAAKSRKKRVVLFTIRIQNCIEKGESELR